jgi:vacuolar-type H+-ATPase subunit I/STV1
MTSTSPDLNGALRGLFKDREWPFKIMMGACINCAAFGLLRVNTLFVPISFGMVGLTYGYLLRAMRQSIKGELETLPGWHDIVDLLTSGLSWLSICLGFGFFVLSLLAISLLAAGNSKILNMSNPSFLYWATGTFLVIYGLVFLFKFFLAVLMANFAEDEKMLAGFAWRKVIRRIAKQPLPLLTAWLAGLTISFCAVLFPTASVVLALLAPFLGFLAEVIAVRMIGQAWATSD